jgi:hypothetical protein
MNLYKISQDENSGYDTFDALIVCAPDEETARNTSPYDGPINWSEHHYSWCSKPEQVTVEFIGVAADSVQPGVVLSSFHAG